MGYRDDNFIDDERADAALKRLLEADSTPPDIVARTLQRLPPGPPAVREPARNGLKIGAVAALFVAVLVLIGGFNIWGVVGSGPQIGFLIGDGQSGASEVLIGLQLAAKPIWNTVHATPLLFVGGAAIALVCFVVVGILIRRVYLHDDKARFS